MKRTALLIVKDEYAYMLGLSATPFSGKSAAKGKELMEFFGGQVFGLPIEDALDRGFLVPYYYYPIFVYATEDEEDRFRKLGHVISSCFKGKVCIDPDKLVKVLRARLRIISMADAKMQKLKEIIQEDISDDDHFVVYCGDGKLFDPKTGRALNNNLLDYKLSTFMDHPTLQAAFVENPEPTSPYGTKALGEPPACSPAPAIRNAILNATGVAFDACPITPHVLYRGFKEAGLIED